MSRFSGHEIAENTTDLETLLLTTHHSGNQRIYKVRMTGMSCICIMSEMLVAYHTHGRHIHFATFIPVRLSSMEVQAICLSDRGGKELSFTTPVLSNCEAMPPESLPLKLSGIQCSISTYFLLFHLLKPVAMFKDENKHRSNLWSPMW